MCVAEWLPASLQGPCAHLWHVADRSRCLKDTAWGHGLEEQGRSKQVMGLRER
jgi:hypothetical protein